MCILGGRLGEGEGVVTSWFRHDQCKFMCRGV